MLLQSYLYCLPVVVLGEPSRYLLYLSIAIFHSCSPNPFLCLSRQTLFCRGSCLWLMLFATSSTTRYSWMKYTSDCFFLSDTESGRVVLWLKPENAESIPYHMLHDSSVMPYHSSTLSLCIWALLFQCARIVKERRTKETIAISVAAAGWAHLCESVWQVW